MTARLAWLALTVIALASLACTRDPSPLDTPAAGEPTAEATPTPGRPFILVTPAVTPGPALPPFDPRSLFPPLPEGVPLDHPGEEPLSAGLDPSGWPRDAVGPLVVYRHLAERDDYSVNNERGSFSGTLSSTYRFVTYDVGAHSEIAAFEVRAAHVPRITLQGNWLFVNYNREVWRYALDGSGGTRIVGGDPDDPRDFEYLAVSPDASRIAVAHYRVNDDVYHDDMVLEVIDAATGAVTFRVTQDEARAAGLQGFLSVRGWSADGEALDVSGHQHKGSFPHSGILRLTDATFHFLEREYPVYIEWLEPLGERPGTRHPGPMCQYGWYPATTRLEFFYPDGRILNTVESEWAELMIWAWSPDGRELLHRRYALPEDIRDPLAAAHARDTCGSDDLEQRAWNSPYTWHILAADGGPPIDLGSVREAYERWLGDRIVSFVCTDEEVVGRIPFGDPEFSESACHQRPIGLRVGGVAVGEGVEVSVLGFVDPTR